MSIPEAPHAWHTHLCRCGTFWLCNKPACRVEDTCSSCEDRQAADYWQARGYYPEQPPLPMKETR